MTEQQLQDIFDYFAATVSKADLTDSKKINFFSATKMLTLETKHSAFFAWLLDPTNEHCLNNAVLKKLLQKTYYYITNGDKDTPKPDSNIDILKRSRNNSEISVTSEQQFVDLANSAQINIFTEKPTTNGKRIDILIDIVATQTVIAIENKIDSTTHDDQLREYENYVNAEYSTYKKKIFIYLTKIGELPYDTDARGKHLQYNNEWCALDYGEIRCIIEELITELKANDKTKKYNIDPAERDTLIIILEHYIKMVDTSILNTSPVAREKCKNLLADPKVKEALEIIAAYKEIPTPEQVTDYACNYLGGLREGSSKYWFYTDPMRNYFTEKKKESYDISKLRCVCQPNDTQKADSKITIFVDVSSERNKGKGFTQAQKDLLLSCGLPITGSDTRVISKFDLVLDTERGLKFDDLKLKLDTRLKAFKTKLDDFTKKYL